MKHSKIYLNTQKYITSLVITFFKTTRLSSAWLPAGLLGIKFHTHDETLKDEKQHDAVDKSTLKVFRMAVSFKKLLAHTVNVNTNPDYLIISCVLTYLVVKFCKWVLHLNKEI